MAKQQSILTHTGLGAQSFEINWKNFAQGQTTSDDTQDGGFSSSTTEANLLTKPGVFLPNAPLVDLSANLTGATVASTTFLGESSRLAFVASKSSGDNYFYMLDHSGTTLNGLTLMQTDTNGANRYQKFYTDMVTFAFDPAGGSSIATYIVTSTAAGDLCVWDGSSTSGTSHFDPTWWTGTKSQSAMGLLPHPMVVFNKNLYVASGNVIYQITAAAAISTVLTLTQETVITSLAIDPTTGKMLVALTSAFASSSLGYLPAENWVGLYDGFNPTQFVKKIPVEAIVTAFIIGGGAVLVGYGPRIGEFTGSGIKFLYKLKNNTTFIGKQEFGRLGNTIYFADGNLLSAFGEVTNGGTKVLYPVKTMDATQTISTLSVFNSSVIIGQAVNGTTYYLNALDTAGSPTSSSSATFYSVDYNMPRSVYVRGIDVQLDAALSGSMSHTLSVIDDSGTTTQIGVFNTSASTTASARLSGANVKTTSIQVKDVISGSSGIKRLIVYYDNAE